MSQVLRYHEAMRPALLAMTAFALLALAVGVNPISNNDVWLHLTTGRLIIERGEVPRLDEYSFTRGGSAYVAHEWLAQVFLFALYRAFGITGLIALKPIALLLTALLVAACCRRIGGGDIASFWSGVLAMTAMTSHLFARPHLFTFVMLAAVSLTLARRNAGQTGPIVILVLLELFWANLHGGFVLGIALVALQGAWLAAGAMAVGALLNPYGAGLYRFVLLFTDPVFRRRIREWSGPFDEPFLGSFHFYVYCGVLLLCIATIAHSLRKRRYGAAAMICLFAALSFVSKRNASVLGVVAAPWIGVSASEWFAARPGRLRLKIGSGPAGALPAMAASCALVVLLAAAAALHGVPHETGRARLPGLGIADNVPVLALDYVLSHHLEGNALNSFAFGSYITWRAWPASKVFIDSRLDVYGGEFVEQYSLAMADPALMRSLMRRYRFDYAVLSYRLDAVEGPVAAFGSDGDWALVYYDDLAMVYVRREPRWAPVIAADEYRRTNPYLFITGRWSAGDDPAGAAAEAQRALGTTPGCLVAGLMEATALQVSGRHREAIAILEASEAVLGPDGEGRPLILGLLGTSYLEQGDRDRARQTFERLLEAQPESAYGKKMLEALEPVREPVREPARREAH